MENVPLAASSPRFTKMTRALEKAGYTWTAAIVNAVQFGSTQSRQRLIFVASRVNRLSPPALPLPTHGEAGRYFHYGKGKMLRVSDDLTGLLGITPASLRTAKLLPTVFARTLGAMEIPRIEEALKGLPRLGTAKAKKIGHVPWTHSPKVLRRMERVPEGGRWRGGEEHFAQAYGRLHRKGLARTVTTFFPNAGSGRFWHPTSERTITLREAARLQGFPDEFLFPEENPSKSAVLIGNALDARLAEVSYQTIRECLE
jgi:DNA (cytosine-5)-methyltransferase 1